MMIDAHIHLDKYDDKERNYILSSLTEHQIEALIAVSFDLASCVKNRSYWVEDARVKPAYGFHPEQEIPSSQDVEALFYG